MKLSYDSSFNTLVINHDRCIRPSHRRQLTISETTKSETVASYLHMLFIRKKDNTFSARLHEKCDSLGSILSTFPYLSENIRSTPSYSATLHSL